MCVRPDFAAEWKSWLSRYGGAEAFSLFEGAPGTHLSLVDRKLALGDAFERLHREYTEKPAGYEASLFAELLRLVVRIHRMRTARHDTGNAAAARGRGRAGLLRLLDDFPSRIAEPLTAEGLAAEAGMSARHFLRLFRELTGTGFSSYVQRKRIELACRLLTEPDGAVGSVAKRVGYQDAAHFREVFRKIVGASPVQYRQNQLDRHGSNWLPNERD